MRRTNSKEARGDVQRCASCFSSVGDPSGSHEHNSSLSGSRRAGSFPPMPRQHSRECMACLKNFVNQKKSMIGSKAQQFLEEKPLPPTISHSSPFDVQGRKMNTLDRSSAYRNSNRPSVL